MSARLLTLRTFHPSSFYPQSFIHQQMKSLLSRYDKTNHYQKTIDSMFLNSAIEKRHMFLSPHGSDYEKQIESPSVERMLNSLVPQVVSFLRNAITTVLSEHDIRPHEVHGYIGTADIPLSPPINLRAVENLGFRREIQYLFPLYHGCIAGLSSMELACNMLKLKPDGVVLTSNVVLSSRFFHGVLQGQFARLFQQINDNNNNNNNNNNNSAAEQKLNLDAEIKNDLMSSTIFGDGVAVSLLVGPQHPLASTIKDSKGRNTPTIVENQGRYVDGTQCHVAQDLLDHGWRSIVSRDVKDLGPLFLSEGLEEFLRTTKLSPSQVSNWCLHPGGPKVLQGLLAKKQFGLTNDMIRMSWKSFREYGNCGGVSVLNVMEQIWEESAENTKAGNNVVAMAIGPGMRTQAMHLRHS